MWQRMDHRNPTKTPLQLQKGKKYQAWLKGEAVGDDRNTRARQARSFYLPPFVVLLHGYFSPFHHFLRRNKVWEAQVSIPQKIVITPWFSQQTLLCPSRDYSQLIPQQFVWTPQLIPMERPARGCSLQHLGWCFFPDFCGFSLHNPTSPRLQGWLR